MTKHRVAFKVQAHVANPPIFSRLLHFAGGCNATHLILLILLHLYTHCFLDSPFLHPPLLLPTVVFRTAQLPSACGNLHLSNPSPAERVNGFDSSTVSRLCLGVISEQSLLGKSGHHQLTFPRSRLRHSSWPSESLEKRLPGRTNDH